MPAPRVPGGGHVRARGRGVRGVSPGLRIARGRGGPGESSPGYGVPSGSPKWATMGPKWAKMGPKRGQNNLGVGGSGGSPPGSGLFRPDSGSPAVAGTPVLGPRSRPQDVPGPSVRALESRGRGSGEFWRGRGPESVYW